MMPPDEKFVGDSLVQYFGGPSAASFTVGENPPDLYFNLGTTRVGVEVTRLPEPMLDPNGISFNRATHDTFALRLLNELNANLGSLVPDGLGLWIVIRVPVGNGTRFRRCLTDWLREIIAAPKLGTYERQIEGFKTKISVIPRRPTGKPIAGHVTTHHFLSHDISLNASRILADRIKSKSAICSELTKPIWLAMLNYSCLADADCYEEAFRQTKLSHCFDRLFIVFDSGAVSELVIRA